jgi:hypothetical protein
MIEVHVEGRIELGRLSEFRTGVRRYCDYLRAHNYVVPRVLHAISGQMNMILLVYKYPDVEGYLRHEQNTMGDADYAAVASGMPFVDGTLTYTIYHPVDDQVQ